MMEHYVKKRFLGLSRTLVVGFSLVNTSWVTAKALDSEGFYLSTDTEHQYEQVFSPSELYELQLSDNTQFFVGRKKMAYSSLIYQQEYNQGIMGSIKLPDLGTSLRTFTADTQATNIYDSQELGIEDQRNRATGIIWEYQPVTEAEQDITFTTSYLSGNNTVDMHNGDAMSFSTSAHTLNRQLHLRGEIAQSSYATYTDNIKNRYDSQEAQHISLHYTPNTHEREKDQGQWDIGIEKKTVDAYFQTLFNRNLPRDKDITRLFGHYNKQQWSVEASVNNEKNNLANQLDTTETIRSGTLLGRYKNPQTSKHWGRRDYSLAYHQSNTIQNYHWQNTDNTSPDANHNRYQGLTFESRHYYDDWHWRYKLGHAVASNKLDLNGHFTNQEIELGTQFSIGKKTFIDTYIRSLQSKRDKTHLLSSEWVHGINIKKIFDKQKGVGNIGLQFYQRDTDINLDDTEQHQTLLFTSNLQARLYQTKALYPNVDLDFSAQYKQDVNDFANIGVNDYQTKMTLSLNWKTE